jgi:hypothetical protein
MDLCNIENRGGAIAQTPLGHLGVILGSQKDANTLLQGGHRWESTDASSNVDRRVVLVSLQLGQETTNYAFHKCIVEGLPREPASVEEGRDD